MSLVNFIEVVCLLLVLVEPIVRFWKWFSKPFPEQLTLESHRIEFKE